MFCKGYADVIFVGKRNGITKDGEKYVAVDVLDRKNKKYQFLTTDVELVDKLMNTEITQFRMVRIFLSINREFNRDKRTSYWVCNLDDLKLSNFNENK